MNQEVEHYISKNWPWSKLPDNVKQLLGGSYKEYDKAVINYSIKNQLRYKGNLVRLVRKDEEHYYEELLEYSKVHLMLYPYHLSDVMVRGLRVTPFQYYISMVESIMLQEKSYDALPNFTAADCLRLLGIGRNQYIDLMNQSRSGRKLFRRRNARELLPLKPMSKMTIEPWWIVNIGSITEDDIKMANESEKVTIDYTIDNGPQRAGMLNYLDLITLYGKGLIYLEVPIESSDHISVPPLEGFVMNRVLGDYFETLLYKIFVSVDEKTSVGELANVLQIGVDQVKNAVSVYCRLGFARKKNSEIDANILHTSWHDVLNASPCKSTVTNSSSDDDPLLAELTAALAELGSPPPTSEQSTVSADVPNGVPSTDDMIEGGADLKRVAFLFDSTLTAFLMMGNLSPGLKSHAVTMFEVGKLSDESLDSLLSELERISTDDSEGEAQRYFEHALTLKSTVQFLRKARSVDGEATPGWNAALDLIRVESLQSLDADTCGRLLRKNYHLLVAMAPLSMDVRAGSVDSLPPFWGPPLPEFTSPWFKLFLYHLTGEGPPTLLLAKGERLRRLPAALNQCERILISPWGHESGLVVTSNALVVLNEALTHSAVMVQGYGNNREEDKVYIPFPLTESADSSWKNHCVVRRLGQVFDLQNSCGFITMINLSRGSSLLPSNQSHISETSSPAPVPKNGIKDSSCAEILRQELDNLEETQEVTDVSVMSKDETIIDPMISPEPRILCNEEDWTILTIDYGIPLFDSQLNRSVCERILSQQLWRKEMLDSLIQTHKSLSSKLMDFINSQVDSTVDGKATKDVALPSKNLLFLHGSLEAWNGQ